MSAVDEAGWHRDPSGRNVQRYWDGRWTDFVAGIAGGPPATDPLLPGEQFPPPGQEPPPPAPAVPSPVTNLAAAPSPAPVPPPPPPPPLLRPTPPADWYLDPAGRHECRYWDGSTWTSHVSDNGQLAHEQLEPAHGNANPVPLQRATPSVVQPQAAQAVSSPATAVSQSPPVSSMTAPSAVTPASAAATAGRTLAGWDLNRWAQLGALVAMAIGVLTAWATASNSFVSASVNGIDSDRGKLFALLLVIVAVVIVFSELRGGQWWVAATCGGVALLIFGIYEVIYIHNQSHGVVSPGFGLYLDLVGAIVLIAAAATIPRFRKAP